MEVHDHIEHLGVIGEEEEESLGMLDRSIDLNKEGQFSGVSYGMGIEKQAMQSLDTVNILTTGGEEEGSVESSSADTDDSWENSRPIYNKRESEDSIDLNEDGQFSGVSYGMGIDKQAMQSLDTVNFLTTGGEEEGSVESGSVDTDDSWEHSRSETFDKRASEYGSFAQLLESIEKQNQMHLNEGVGDDGGINARSGSISVTQLAEIMQRENDLQLKEDELNRLEHELKVREEVLDVKKESLVEREEMLRLQEQQVAQQQERKIPPSMNFSLDIGALDEEMSNTPEAKEYMKKQMEIQDLKKIIYEKFDGARKDKDDELHEKVSQLQRMRESFIRRKEESTVISQATKENIAELEAKVLTLTDELKEKDEETQRLKATIEQQEKTLHDVMVRMNQKIPSERVLNIDLTEASHDNHISMINGSVTDNKQLHNYQPDNDANDSTEVLLDKLQAQINLKEQEIKSLYRRRSRLGLKFWSDDKARILKEIDSKINEHELEIVQIKLDMSQMSYQGETSSSSFINEEKVQPKKDVIAKLKEQAEEEQLHINEVKSEIQRHEALVEQTQTSLAKEEEELNRIKFNSMKRRLVFVFQDVDELKKQDQLIVEKSELVANMKSTLKDEENKLRVLQNHLLEKENLVKEALRVSLRREMSLVALQEREES